MTQTVAIDESSFIMYLNETVNELIGKYRPRYVILPDTVYNEIDNLDAIRINAPINIYGIYSQCVTENIIYLINGDQNRKTDFINHAEQAYLTIYREICKGLRVKPLSFCRRI